MDTPAKFTGASVFQLEFYEARHDAFFWRYRTADGWLVAESQEIYPNLEECVTQACEFLIHSVSDQPSVGRGGH